MDNNLDLEITYKNSSSYPVIIRDDYDCLAGLISEMFPNLQRICIITKKKKKKLFLAQVKEKLSDVCPHVTDFVFEAGEKSKNLDTVKACYDKLLSVDFNRRDLVIGLGGGVAGDLAAFVASSYMRGCPFVNLPTSLLAMCDSSVGGKCGVDYDRYKNIVGSIYIPSLVYIAVNTLKMLPDREFSSGMAEVLKAGLIRDAAFYEHLITDFSTVLDKDNNVLKAMISKAVAIKQYYVTKDPFEQNERMILNFGHTIGHALEKYFDFKYSHGECVALGSVAASYISYKRSMLSDEEFYEIRDMFVPFLLPISLDEYDVEEALKNIIHDKKNTDTGLKFILLKKIGKAVIVNDVKQDEIRDAMNNLIVRWD